MVDANNPLAMRAGVEELLSQLREASNLSGRPASAKSASAAAVDFGQALKSALDRVNETQLQANRLAQDVELERGGAALSDAMIAMQKANISFQQASQVRNRLVAAYHEIMNMQI